MSRRRKHSGEPAGRAPSESDDYYLLRQIDVELGGHKLRIVTKPGIPHWDSVTPATRLLVDAAGLLPGARVLVIGGGHGALAAALARRAAGCTMLVMDFNALALDLAKQTLEANDIAGASPIMGVDLPEAELGTFDAVVIEAPPLRQLARRWLLQAYHALKPGGILFLAGPNAEGIQPMIADTGGLFGSAATLGFKAKNRVARAQRPRLAGQFPAWASEPGIAPGTFLNFNVNIANSTLAIRSLPGVFAYDRLDAGTALLLDHLRPLVRGRVLDVGCGYGIIGLLAAQDAAVDLIDINLMAVEAARATLRANNRSDATVIPSDVYSAVRHHRYDLIASNPPFHAGKAVNFDVAQTLIAGAHELLNPGGQLLIVANRFIRYDQQMRSLFQSVHVLAETAGFRLLLANR